MIKPQHAFLILTTIIFSQYFLIAINIHLARLEIFYSRYSAIMCYLTNNGYDQSHCTSQTGVFSYYFFIHYLPISRYYITTFEQILDNFHIFVWFLLEYSHVLPHFHRFYSALFSHPVIPSIIFKTHYFIP